MKEMLTIELPLYLLKETIPPFDTYVYIEVIEEAGGVCVCVAQIGPMNNLTELAC